MAASDDAAGATRHDDLAEIAKTAIGAEVGLSAEQSRRLNGASADELRRDARAMAHEVGIDVNDEHDDGGRERDRQGRFARSEGDTMNSIIRAASGR